MPAISRREFLKYSATHAAAAGSHKPRAGEESKAPPSKTEDGASKIYLDYGWATRPGFDFSASPLRISLPSPYGLG